MKKLLSVLLALFIGITMVLMPGCGAQPDSSSKSQGLNQAGDDPTDAGNTGDTEPNSTDTNDTGPEGSQSSSNKSADTSVQNGASTTKEGDQGDTLGSLAPIVRSDDAYVPNFKGATIKIAYNGYTETTAFSSLTGQYLKKRIADIERLVNCKIQLRNINSVTDATNMAAGKPPSDIYATNGPSTLATYVKKGYMYPLDDLGINFNSANFDKNTVQAGYINGKHYALNRKAEGVYKIEYLTFTAVNTDLLSKIGYDMNTLYKWQEKGEWTWSKFEELCNAMVQTGGSNPDGTPVTYGSILRIPQTFVSTNGGDLIKKSGSSFSVDTSSKNIIEGFTFLQRMYQSKAMKSFASWDEFRNGKALFFLDLQGWALRTSWACAGMKNLAIITMPKGPNASGYESKLDFVETYGILSSSVAGNKQKAKDLAAVLDMYFAPLIPSSSAAKVEESQMEALVNDVGSFKVLKSLLSYSKFAYNSFVNLDSSDVASGAQFGNVFNSMMKGADVSSTLKANNTAWNNAAKSQWK